MCWKLKTNSRINCICQIRNYYEGRQGQAQGERRALPLTYGLSSQSLCLDRGCCSGSVLDIRFEFCFSFSCACSGSRRGCGWGCGWALFLPSRCCNLTFFTRVFIPWNPHKLHIRMQQRAQQQSQQPHAVQILGPKWFLAKNMSN